MSRADLYIDLSADLVHSASRDLIQAMSPRRMSNDERRANLRALADVVNDEAGWDVRPVVMPWSRSMARYYATVHDDAAFGRLLIAVREYRQAAGASDRERASDHIVAALDRLVPAEVAA